MIDRRFAGVRVIQRAISSAVRAHPSHRPVRSSITQTSTQGDSIAGSEGSLTSPASR